MIISPLPIMAVTIIGVLAWLIVRTGASALRLTGISADAATFQAVSGFFGVGFTTSEAEMIVDHPVRRRIMTHLIIAGNLGITSGLATLVITFVDASYTEDRSFALTFWVVVAAITLIVVASKTEFLNNAIDRVVSFTLSKTAVAHVLDYETVLRTRRGYVVEEFRVSGDHELAGKSLREVALRERGVLVLGVSRADDEYVGAPTPDTDIREGDVLTVYGLEDTLKEELRGASPQA